MPRPNDYVAAVHTFSGALTPEECVRIRTHAASLAEGRVGVYPEPARPVRLASTKIIAVADEMRWVVQRILSFVHAANQCYQFALDDEVKPLLLVNYPTGGYFDWHTDLAGGEESTRKISVSIQLSAPEEYDGGSLHIVSHEHPLSIGAIGTLTAFPAHLAHRVLPVDRGHRFALVTWVHGPSFR